MDLIPQLSAIILVAVIITIVIALFSYVVFKLRERRSPEMLKREASKRKFFRRYTLTSRG